MKHRATVLGITAMLAIVIYALVPIRHFDHPIFPLRPTQRVSVYDDRADGGHSVGSMVLADSLLDFECTLEADTLKEAWCGLIWEMDAQKKGTYENWTFMDSIVMDFSASRLQEINIKIWTYDPDVTDPKKPTSFRQLLKEVPVHEGLNHIVIPVEQFYVPDFWFVQTGAKRDLTQRHQESVARFEITPGWKTPRGTPFFLKIRRIEARGVSNRDFGILLGVFLIIAILAIGLKRKK